MHTRSFTRSMLLALILTLSAAAGTVAEARSAQAVYPDMNPVVQIRPGESHAAVSHIAADAAAARTLAARTLAEMTLTKGASTSYPAPGQRITYTLTAVNTLTDTAMTGALISDTLPAGLVFAGPVTLDPPGAGMAGSAPPLLAHSLTISPGQSVDVTFAVTVEAGLPATAVITNTATITSSQVPTPTAATQVLFVAGIMYVDTSAGGAGNGQSWTDAYTTLQDALAAAGYGDELWVAEGVYYPDQGAGQSDNDRTSTFMLKNGVALFGGFAGTETVRTQRDWATHVTILSGDIDGNDTNTDGNGVAETWNDIQGNNAYHVVTGSGANASAVLDGLTITAGDADGTDPNDRGGGLTSVSGSPQLANLSLCGNYATYYGGGISLQSSSPGLVHVTLSGNYAHYIGGGIYSYQGQPSLDDVSFDGNTAYYYGGGMANNESSDAVLSNVIFRSNQAVYESGGGMYNYSSNPQVSHALFVGNSARRHGGGVSNGPFANGQFVNVAFYGNYAGGASDSAGGGMYTYNGSQPQIVNATLAGNSASVHGGGLAIYYGGNDATLTNCILWGNTAGTAGDQVYLDSGDAATLNTSLVEGGCPDGATCNAPLLSGDPRFLSPIAASFAPTTTGDYRLTGGSPAIDAGDSSAVAGLSTDLDGERRITGLAVDLGAYEYAGLALIKQASTAYPAAGQRVTYTLTAVNSSNQNHVSGALISDTLPAGLVFAGPITLDPPGAGTVGSAPPLLAFNLSISPGHHITLTFPVTVAAGLPATTVITNTASITSNQMPIPILAVQSLFLAGIIYVDADATGTGDGTSWANAYTILQDALAAADYGDELWVAEGVYYPDEGVGQTNDDRSASFALKRGVALYGGFDGGSSVSYPGGETLRSQRDWDTHLTILIGDIDHETNPDTNIDGNNVAETWADIQGANAYHVVLDPGLDASASLDGFIVTAGLANGSDPHNSGGGMLVDSGSSHVANVAFSGNQANRGGGLYNNTGSPQLINVSFGGNRAALYDGGGLYNWSDGNPTLTNVAFSGNQAERDGGGMYSYNAPAALTSVAFYGNFAGENGGGMANREDSTPSLVNVTWSGNRAGGSGGGLYNNRTLYGGQPTLANCILWGNTDPQMANEESNPTLSYSLVQDGCPGGATCNSPLLTDDPRFLAPLSASSAPTTTGDYRLAGGSPAINAGDKTALPGGEGLALTDLGGNPRVLGGELDLGSYEYAGLALAKRASTPYPAAGQRVTYTLTAINAFTTTQVNGALISDTLPAGLSLAGPVTLDPPGAGSVGSALPLLAHNLTISAGQVVTLTFPVTIEAGLPATAVITNTASVTSSQVPIPVEAIQPILVAGVIYVDADAAGSGDGISWANAYTALQDALAVAASGDEIWVAEGIYYPDEGAGQTNDERSSSFFLKSGVALYGGFGGTETRRTQRDWDTHPTILSGDIDHETNPDTNTDGNKVAETWADIQGNNAYHVVLDPGTDTGAVLDGFSVTAGEADGSDPDDRGGGLLNDSGSPQLANLAFRGNQASNNGGGLYTGDGGDLSLTKVAFHGNQANDGGGLYNDQSILTLTGVEFRANQANQSGGGMYTYVWEDIYLINTLFSGNRAAQNGGGMYVHGYAWLYHVTLSANQANQGGAIYNYNSSLRLYDCALWGNAAASSGPQMASLYGYSSLYHSLVQAGCPSDANCRDPFYTADPQFLAPVTATLAPTTTGDYHLAAGSPAIDAGDNSDLPAGISTDLDGRQRIVGSTVDLGPYEAHPDVAIVKTVTPGAASSGMPLTYTLAFSNAGAYTTTGVIINDIVPSALDPKGFGNPSGLDITRTPGISYAWAISGSLAPAQGGLITITGVLSDPLGGGVLTNTATIAANLDGEAANNSSSATVTMLAAGSGPGGVGAFGLGSSLKLWLRADAGVSASGGAVSAWADQSGHNLDMSQGAAASQPTLVAGALNGQPALSFDGGDDYLASATLVSDSLPVNQATVFAVSLADNSAQQSNLYATNPLDGNRFSAHLPWSGTIYFDMGACCGPDARISTPYDAGWLGSFHVWGYRAEAGLGKAIYRNGAALISDTNGTSSFITQTSYNFTLGYPGAPSNYYAGDVAELAIYNTPLILARRVLVENYLSAKYDIALDLGSGAKDVYVGDEGTHGDYDFDVAGIGQEPDGANTIARSAGLVIQESGGSLDDGEYVLAGHKVPVNSTTTDGLPPYVAHRWERVWYVDKTATDGVDITLAFDFDQAGFGGLPEGDYVLLYSAGTPLSFSDTGLAAALFDDQVRFSVPDTVWQDGYYTLGKAVPLGLVKSVSPRVDVARHSLLTYSLVLDNAGTTSDTLRLTDALPDKLAFAAWLEQPAGASVSGAPGSETVTWQGVLSAETSITFTFQVTHTGDYAEIITNTVTFSGTLAAGQAQATFSVAPSPYIHVNAAATGAATGLSWTDAFTNVQDALAVAFSGDEIWVAQGVYYPDQGAGQTDNARTSTFSLTHGVALYGGFSGVESERDARDPHTHVTILSGDIDGDDTNTDGNKVAETWNDQQGANAYHVISSYGAGASTVLDGFTVTAGHADGSLPHDSGGGMYNASSSPTLAALAFYGNRAIRGGGMDNDSSSPSMVEAVFSGNFANNGGGMYNNVSSPDLVEAVFSGNFAYAGGGMYNNSSSPGLANTVFKGNQAWSAGGMQNISGSNPRLVNVAFYGNRASTSQGGGMDNSDSSPSLIQVSFGGNRASNGGGGINNSAGSNPQLDNCILWGNAPDQMASSSSAPSLSHSLVQDGCPNRASCDQLLDLDPHFVAPIAASSAPTTTGNYRLGAGSGAIEAGDNDALAGQGLALTDLDGKPRVLGARVDLGAYEFSGLALTKRASIAHPAAGQRLTYTLMAVNAYTDTTMTGVLISDTLPPSQRLAGPITLDPPGAGSVGSALPTLAYNLSIGAGHDVTVSFPVTLDAGLPALAAITNTATITSNEVLSPIVAQASLSLAGSVYVDANAVGAATGLSWTDAFTNVQDALAVASRGDEVWVAEGVYYPDQGAGQTDGARASTFTLKDGVALYGGFVGTETLRSQRDWRAHVTVLSGDVDGDDVNTDGNSIAESAGDQQGANAYHVATISGAGPDTVLDGFTLTAGRADQIYNFMGGGLSIRNSSPHLARLAFYGNTADSGGGMSSLNSAPHLADAIFSGNQASSGGGLYTFGSDARLENVILTGNQANEGGGLHNSDGSPQLTNATLSGNQATSGGGLYNTGSYALINSIVWGNDASLGAQIYNPYTSTAPIISYSLVGGGCPSGAACDHLLTPDPQFVAPITATSAPTSTGDYRLQATSAAIDAGEYLSVTASTDLDGKPRLQACTVDLGAYEATLDLAACVDKLAITPSAGPGRTLPVAPGSPVTYSLRVFNGGTLTVTGVIITDIVPTALVGAGLKPAPTGLAITRTPGITYAWSVADLAPGAGGLITITGVLSDPLAAGVSFTNTATIVATAARVHPSSAILTVLDVPPLVGEDGYTTNEDTPFTTGNVLANDRDPNGGSIAFASFEASSALGTVLYTGGGTFFYSPVGPFNHLGAGEQAVDAFTYVISDSSGLTATGTVSITVTGLNDAPIARDDRFTLGQDRVLEVPTPGVLFNDSDPDDPLSAVLTGGGVAHGTLVLAADGSFVYTPTAGYAGTDGFSYYASGGAGAAFAQVTLDVQAIQTATIPITGTGRFGFGALCGGIYVSHTTDVNAITVTQSLNYPSANRDGLRRRYDISADGTDLEASLTLCYEDTDLLVAGITYAGAELDLHVYRFQGAVDWQTYSEVDPIANTVTAHNVTELGVFGLGVPSDRPTVVRQSGLHALSGRGLGWILLAALAACAGVWWVKRRK